MRIEKNTLLIVFAAFCLSGCTTWVTIPEKEEPDLGVIEIGADRRVVEHELGNPIGVVTHESGRSACIYEFEIGNKFLDTITIHYNEVNKVQKIM